MLEEHKRIEAEQTAADKQCFWQEIKKEKMKDDNKSELFTGADTIISAE